MVRGFVPLLAISCATPRPDLPEAKRQVEAYVSSGTYAADIAQVAGEARRYLESRMLRAAGYDWTRLVMKPEGLAVKSAVDFKAPERKRLAVEGYTIVLNLGDQQGDLDGGFAERTFKVPNPFDFGR